MLRVDHCMMSTIFLREVLNQGLILKTTKGYMT